MIPNNALINIASECHYLLTLIKMLVSVFLGTQYVCHIRDAMMSMHISIDCDELEIYRSFGKQDKGKGRIWKEHSYIVF